MARSGDELRARAGQDWHLRLVLQGQIDGERPIAGKVSVKLLSKPDESDILPEPGPGGRLCRICAASWFYAEFWDVFAGRCLDCRIAAGEQMLPEDDDVFF
jgi:hypothetical protein